MEHVRIHKKVLRTMGRNSRVYTRPCTFFFEKKKNAIATTVAVAAINAV